MPEDHMSGSAHTPLELELLEALKALADAAEKAKAEFHSNTRTPTQCAYMMVAHLNAALAHGNVRALLSRATGQAHL